MYGHSDDLQRFTLLSWAALQVPRVVFPHLSRLPVRGVEVCVSVCLCVSLCVCVSERERERVRERERGEREYT